MRTQGETSHPQAKEKVLRRNQPWLHLDFWFLASKNMGEKSFCPVSHPVHCPMWWQPPLTEALSLGSLRSTSHGFRPLFAWAQGPHLWGAKLMIYDFSSPFAVAHPLLNLLLVVLEGVEVNSSSRCCFCLLWDGMIIKPMQGTDSELSQCLLQKFARVERTERCLQMPGTHCQCGG